MAPLSFPPLLPSRGKVYIGRIEHEGLQMTILQKLANYAAYRRTVRELGALDSAQLRDIGLTRQEIRAAARAAN
jgi:uncharacterized protein YjiS (DUF1127 family)